LTRLGGLTRIWVHGREGPVSELTYTGFDRRTRSRRLTDCLLDGLGGGQRASSHQMQSCRASLRPLGRDVRGYVCVRRESSSAAIVRPQFVSRASSLRNTIRLVLKLLLGAPRPGMPQAQRFGRSILHMSVRSRLRFAAIDSAPALALVHFVPPPFCSARRREETVTCARDRLRLPVGR
jgi:hypothetical protein